MDDTILVAYATRYGSTKEIAGAIADTLRSGGETVDLLPMGEVTDIGRYRAAVVGSPIYMGKWLSDAQIFIERQQKELRRMPVAFFSVGMTVVDKTEDGYRRAEAAMDQVRLLVQPVEIGLFAGKLEPSDLSLPDRAIVALVRAPSGDYRNWDEIRTWASGLIEKLR